MEIRAGSLADSYTVFKVFQDSLYDFSNRTGVMAITGGNDPGAQELIWKHRQSLWEHLAQTADQFWIAEENGIAIGYARSILRNGLRELTEFFVKPGFQSTGIGRQLIEKAFPKKGANRRLIIATNEPAALALYMKMGVYAHIPEYYFSREVLPVASPRQIDAVNMAEYPDALELIGQVDDFILEHRRDIDHTWLMQNRQGYLYFRSSQLLGYGYVGREFSGPFALIDNSFFPAVISHAEFVAYTIGATTLGFEVPLINHLVINHLLERKYLLDGFLGSIMVDEPFGKFKNYLLTSPPFFL